MLIIAWFFKKKILRSSSRHNCSLLIPTYLLSIILHKSMILLLTSLLFFKVIASWDKYLVFAQYMELVYAACGSVYFHYFTTYGIYKIKIRIPFCFFFLNKKWLCKPMLVYYYCSKSISRMLYFITYTGGWICQFWFHLSFSFINLLRQVWH